MQQGKAAKVDGGGGNSSTQKSTLLEQLGLVASSMNSTGSTPSNGGPSEGQDSEEKTDSGAEGEKREEVDNVDPFLPVERPPQKNKKKCWICRSKLELAQRELGTCKCGTLIDFHWKFLVQIKGTSPAVYFQGRGYFLQISKERLIKGQPDLQSQKPVS